MSDFILTLDSDDEAPPQIAAKAPAAKKAATKKPVVDEAALEKDDLDPEFSFDVFGAAKGGEADWNMADDTVADLGKEVSPFDTR